MKTLWRLLLLLAPLALAAPVRREIRPVVQFDSPGAEVDDPAIWVNRADPARSLIVGTIKMPKPQGGLAVFDLDGKVLEKFAGIDRPNNVDIHGDICITTERYAHRLRIFRVAPEKPHLRPIGEVPVFAGEPGEASAPMGIGIYERASDHALFAVVSRKSGPAAGYLWQYKLAFAGGGVSGEKVRAFGAFSGGSEIEAVAIDNLHGLIYYSDEDCCVRVYHADPNAPDAAREIARFAESGFTGNREGIAVAGDFVIVTDQLTPRSEYHIYKRGSYEEVEIWRGRARSTDGIDAIAAPMGPQFPKGFLVVMNDRLRNFQLYQWPL